MIHDPDNVCKGVVFSGPYKETKGSKLSFDILLVIFIKASGPK